MVLSISLMPIRITNSFKPNFNAIFFSALIIAISHPTSMNSFKLKIKQKDKEVMWRVRVNAFCLHFFGSNAEEGVDIGC